MKLRTLFLLLPLVLAACSGLSRSERDAQALARYLEFAGPPVNSFSYLGRVNGWTSLGRDQLIVFTGVNDAYLISVEPPCRDLDFVNRIVITHTGNTVSTGFDAVRVDGQRCRIAQIRPVDYGAVRRAAREEREAAAG